MPIDMREESSIPSDTDACCETVASQEELYLEEREEELRAIFTSDGPFPSGAIAEYWQGKIEELELVWEVEKFYGQSEQ